MNFYGLLLTFENFAKNLIANYGPDGQAAYKALKAFYSESNSAILLMELSWANGRKSWEEAAKE